MKTKAQEEIMGFTMIVVIVMVIGVIFMFLLIPNKPERSNLELENLLNAWLNTNVGEDRVRDSISECESFSCESLNKEIPIIKDAFVAKGTINTINGWSINITYSDKVLANYSEGKMIGNSKAAFVPVSSSLVKLKVWYADSNN